MPRASKAGLQPSIYIVATSIEMRPAAARMGCFNIDVIVSLRQSGTVPLCVKKRMYMEGKGISSMLRYVCHLLNIVAIQLL